MSKLTIGVEITEQQRLDCYQKCCVQVGQNSVRLDIATAAGAIADLYNTTLDREILFRSLDVHKGEWYYWTGKHWKHYPATDLRKDIGAVINQITSRQLTELVHTIEIANSVVHNTFDARGVVVFENAALELVGNHFATHAFVKEHYSTFYIPVAFKNVPTPHWDKIITRAFPNKLDADTIQELFGYSLFPAYQAQVMFLLYGDGGTGKGTITKVLAEMVGPSRVAGVALSTLGETHGLAGLVGAFVNIDSEAEWLRPEDENILKRITGGDIVTIDEKWKPQYGVRLPVRMIMTCNQLPKFQDRTDALWQRLVIVPFDVPVPPGDRLEEGVLWARIKPELSGILWWGVEGLIRVLKRKQTRAVAFTQSPRAREILAGHRVYSDPWLAWYEECVEADPEDVTPKELAYSDYKRYCLQFGYSHVAENKFAMAMKRRGHWDSKVGPKDSRTRVWRGLRLRPQA